MAKPRVQTLELFQNIRAATEAYKALDQRLRLLRRRRLISPETWKKEIATAKQNITKVLEGAWRRLHQKASNRDFPELIREDIVKEQFGISHQTLYRRRSNRELPYVKDNEGVIWYPLYDLLGYVLKGKTAPKKQGRPRKF